MTWILWTFKLFVFACKNKLYFYTPSNYTFHFFWIAFKSFLNTVLKITMPFVEKKPLTAFEPGMNGQMRLRCRY